MLFWYGFRLGTKSLLTGHFSKEAIKQLIVPVNYWRTVEFRLAISELAPRPGDRILDVGSPKLLSLYLSDQAKADVYSTDIDEYFIRDYERFRKLKRVSAELFHTLVVDGRRMQFSGETFDKVFSISVLEHIPDKGDSECMKEICRVLRKDGLCVITVPFAPQAQDQFKDPFEFYWSAASKKDNATGKIFYQRRYDETALHTRLVEPSGLHLKKILYLGERLQASPEKEVADYLPPATGVIQPFLSTLLHTVSTDWRQLKKPLGAMVVLQK